MEKSDKPQDKEVRSLFSNLNQIDFNKLIPLEQTSEKDKHKLAKIIVESKDSNRRVEEKCEIKFFMHKYLCLKEDNSLKFFNKDYKNICKRQIEKMSLDEGVIRKCLLALYDKQVTWFISHKDSDPLQYKIALRDLKIDDPTKYEDSIYYFIVVESIIYPQPTEPKSIHLYDKYIKKFQDEIRYLISIENYTEAISWCNSIHSKFFNMNKELKKQMTEDIRKKLLQEMKSIILNKTMAWIKKPNKETKKDYQEVIKIILKEYYVYFPNIKDDKYIKITARLAKCYLEVRDLEKCEITLKELMQLTKNDENVKQIYDSFNTLKQNNTTKTKKNIFGYFTEQKKMSDDNDELDDNTVEWDNAVDNLDLEANLEVSLINCL